MRSLLSLQTMTFRMFDFLLALIFKLKLSNQPTSGIYSVVRTYCKSPILARAQNPNQIKPNLNRPKNNSQPKYKLNYSNLNGPNGPLQ
ncbi:hypothetical protein V6Z11_D12G291600 [Gossypium hirsutum]